MSHHRRSSEEDSHSYEEDHHVEEVSQEVPVEGHHDGSLLNQKSEYTYLNKIATYTNWCAVVVLLVIAILYTVVITKASTWFLILWTVFAWGSVITMALISYYNHSRLNKSVKANKSPDGWMHLIALASLIDLFVFVLTLIPTSMLFSSHIKSYLCAIGSSAVAYDSWGDNICPSEYLDAANGIDIMLIVVCALCVPLLCMLYVTIRLLWVATHKKEKLLKDYSYIAIIGFAAIAFCLLICLKYALYYATYYNLPFVDPTFLKGLTVAAILAIVVAVLGFLALSSHQKKYFLLLGAFLFLITLVVVGFAGVDRREYSSKDVYIVADWVNNKYWESNGIMKYLPVDDGAYCPTQLQRGDECYNVAGAWYMTQYIKLPFDLTVIFAMFLASYGFIILSILVLFVSNKLPNARSKGLFSRDSYPFLFIFAIVLLAGVLLVALLTPTAYTMVPAYKTQSNWIYSDYSDWWQIYYGYSDYSDSWWNVAKTNPSYSDWWSLYSDYSDYSESWWIYNKNPNYSDRWNALNIYSDYSDWWMVYSDWWSTYSDYSDWWMVYSDWWSTYSDWWSTYSDYSDWWSVYSDYSNYSDMSTYYSSYYYSSYYSNSSDMSTYYSSYYYSGYYSDYSNYSDVLANYSSYYYSSYYSNSSDMSTYYSSYYYSGYYSDYSNYSDVLANYSSYYYSSYYSNSSDMSTYYSSYYYSGYYSDKSTSYSSYYYSSYYSFGGFDHYSDGVSLANLQAKQILQAQYI